MRVGRLVAMVGVTLLAVRADAARRYIPKVMVSDLTADPTFKPAVLHALDDFLAGAVHDKGFRVISHQDVVAALGLDKQKRLLGCNDSNCLAEIGGALGADYIVRGNLAVLDRETALTLSLVDTKGQSINEVRELVPSTNATNLIRAEERLVARLLAPILDKVAPPAPVGGLVGSTKSRGPGAGTYVLVGAGSAAVIAGAILGVLSLGNYSAANSAAASGKPYASDVSASLTEGRIGVPLLALGAAAVVTGTVLWASSGNAQPAGAP